MTSDITLAIAGGVLPDTIRVREGYAMIGYMRGERGTPVWLSLPFSGYEEAKAFLTGSETWHEFTCIGGDKVLVRRDLAFEVTSASPETQLLMAKDRDAEEAWRRRRAQAAEPKPPWAQ